ncbi:ABC transporter permease [Mameliella alba]|uniref:Binding-protein-dependent transport systems inner membrane component n=1 Tax=Mameliella alba TaxID=561184 RepID=A0A0B3SB90_9RHOB|nr:ABC transporter permease [Mameliella alba]KHQ53926.1 Binding-protein-dependent transport systems inner membrane component [Mameliella alba]
MGLFILRRVGVMLMTAFCLTFIVFVMTNLYPNLEKLAKSEGNFRMTDIEVATWLSNNGYRSPLDDQLLADLNAGRITQAEASEQVNTGFDPRIFRNYAEWLGIYPGWTRVDRDGNQRGRCILPGSDPAEAPTFCGVLQGHWGWSTVSKAPVTEALGTRMGNTGFLMLCVMLLMIPSALIVGVLAGMREGSALDRTLSTFSITTTATPEYVSGVLFIAIFTSSAVGLKWFKGTATSAMENPNFENFFLPVLTIALYGMGYIARMTRASMAEVMTAQYIRTARLKGVSFGNIVMKHALRNALIAPFTVIMLQFPWLLNGVVIVETLFQYKGVGWELVRAAGNNDIEMLLAISVVSVFVVLVTQLISDIGYVYLNPRISVT